MYCFTEYFLALVVSFLICNIGLAKLVTPRFFLWCCFRTLSLLSSSNSETKSSMLILESSMLMLFISSIFVLHEVLKEKPLWLACEKFVRKAVLLVLERLSGCTMCNRRFKFYMLGAAIIPNVMDTLLAFINHLTTNSLHLYLSSIRWSVQTNMNIDWLEMQRITLFIKMRPIFFSMYISFFHIFSETL